MGVKKNGFNSSYIVIPDNFELKLDSFVIPRCYHGDLSSVMIPHGLIGDRVKCLAKDIHEVIGDQPLVMLCILKGSYRFFTTLVDELTAVRASCSHPLMIDFIRLKSYTNCERTDKVQIIGLSSGDDLKDKNVMIVEDIVDTGSSLSHLINTLKNIDVKQMWTAILLSKRVQREHQVQEDFVAFEVPNKFIVGYGLDYNQKFRDLNHVCVMSEAGVEKHKITV